MATAKSRKNRNLHSTEYVVDALCVSVKKMDTYFHVYAAGFPASYFQISNSRYPFTGANKAEGSHWYKLTLRFFKNNQPCVPRAEVTSSLPMEAPAGGPDELRHSTTYTERRAPTKAIDESRQRDSPAEGGQVQSQEPRKPLHELDDIGVVCYVEKSRCYVYSMVNEREAIVEDPSHSLHLGSWIKFNM